jgi:hypothetical protein
MGAVCRKTTREETLDFFLWGTGSTLYGDNLAQACSGCICFYAPTLLRLAVHPPLLARKAQSCSLTASARNGVGTLHSRLSTRSSPAVIAASLTWQERALSAGGRGSEGSEGSPRPISGSDFAPLYHCGVFPALVRL